MHFLAVVVAFGIAFAFSLATELQARDDTSLDIFSDAGWPDLEDSNLSLNDDNIFEDTDSDLLLASACDAESDLVLLSKLRARDNDNGVCLNKSPTPPTSSWWKFPDIWKIFTQPSTEQQEQQGPVPNKDGFLDKCAPPFKYNLCCEGRVWGLGETAVWTKIENCYASMPLKMLPLMHKFIIDCQ